MPAKPQKQTKPTVETAFSGFQELFSQMKNQQASWMHYVNIQTQGETFDVARLLQSAFFMQSLANRQTFIDYEDDIQVEYKKVTAAFDKQSLTLVYDRESTDSADEQKRLYVLDTSTAIIVEKHNNDWTKVRVLTFDRKVLDGSPPGTNSIKQMLDSLTKENNVQMETC